MYTWDAFGRVGRVYMVCIINIFAVFVFRGREAVISEV